MSPAWPLTPKPDPLELLPNRPTPAASELVPRIPVSLLDVYPIGSEPVRLKSPTWTVSPFAAEAGGAFQIAFAIVAAIAPSAPPSRARRDEGALSEPDTGDPPPPVTRRGRNAAPSNAARARNRGRGRMARRLPPRYCAMNIRPERRCLGE